MNCSYVLSPVDSSSRIVGEAREASPLLVRTDTKLELVQVSYGAEALACTLLAVPMSSMSVVNPAILLLMTLLLCAEGVKPCRPARRQREFDSMCGLKTLRAGSS